MQIDIIKLTCKRCGHQWVPRIPDPRACPKCQSYLWDKEKEQKSKPIIDS